MPIRRVLFAIRDPLAARQPGLTKAIQIARAQDATLELFHALTDPVYVEFARLEDTDVDRQRERTEEEMRIPLARLCALARRHGVTATSTVTWDYPAHEAVVRRAALIGASLIIAECHRGARTRPWLVHLTDWELLQTSPLPVLLLRNGKPWHRPVVLGAVDPTHTHAKTSALDTRIVAAARDISQRLRGTMHVMHAAHPPMLASIRGAPVTGNALTWSTMTYAAYQEEARIAFAMFFKGEGILASRAHLVPGDPAAEIPRLAQALHARIVVMGAVSRSGLKRLFIGNTAERALESIPCDVLVVKPDGFHSSIGEQSRGMRVEVPPPLGLTAP